MVILSQVDELIKHSAETCGDAACSGAKPAARFAVEQGTWSPLVLHQPTCASRLGDSRQALGALE